MTLDELRKLRPVFDALGYDDPYSEGAQQYEHEYHERVEAYADKCEAVIAELEAHIDEMNGAEENTFALAMSYKKQGDIAREALEEVIESHGKDDKHNQIIYFHITEIAKEALEKIGE